jgi:hypothetical protein
MESLLEMLLWYWTIEYVLNFFDFSQFFLSVINFLGLFTLLQYDLFPFFVSFLIEFERQRIAFL